MREVLMAKITTNLDFKSYIYESGDKQLVEASANDLYWSSGLPFNITVTTTPDKYPGKNMFEKLLSDIRSELRNNDIKSVKPTPASQGTAVTVPSRIFLETPIHAQLYEATVNSSVCEAVSHRKVTPKPRSSNIQAPKSSRRSTTPLFRDVFKQDAKRKRVNHLKHVLQQIPCMSLMILSLSSPLFFLRILQIKDLLTFVIIIMNPP